ncbi:hypothetical protein [Saccharothrix deserti]|uniref:hypothetical protein n=1 Tax=Saccharothrix deserti TaxID=2593674 RepID=UPI00131C7AD8|nr:hypothetical protein [Saccharothrix deserti]
MRTSRSLTVFMAAVVLTSCTATGGEPAPAPTGPSFDSTEAVVAFRQADRVRFANAAGRVWGDVPVKSPDWAWSADAGHFALLDENRLHIVDSETGEDASQPCPCHGLGVLGDRFATISSDGAALLLFAPGAEAERVPLQRPLTAAELVAGGRERVAVAEPIPEELADYRGQSALFTVDATGALTPLIEGKSAVSIWDGTTSPDGTRLATVESPSGGACHTQPGVFSLRYDETNPVQERAVPSDPAFTRAVLGEVRMTTGLRWAGDDLVVTFGPNPGCQNLLAPRYLTYRLDDGKWEQLAVGVLELGFGADGRSYAVELPDVVEAGESSVLGAGKFVVTNADGTRKEVGDNVQGFALTPAEEAAGEPKARPLPEPEPIAGTTDRGAPLDTEYRDLAERIADAAESGDLKALESLCGKCDAPTRELIGTPEGREAIRRALRTHPAVDDRSATYPGLAVKRCVDEPVHAEACTAQQIGDIGLLGLEPDFDIRDGLEDIFRAPVTGSVRLEVDERGDAHWAGRSSSAEPYKVKTAVEGMPESYFFMPPEGDYYCGIFDEMAGCQGRTQPIPPRPESCGEGPSWGGGMFVDSSGKVDFLCAGGVMFYWGDKSEPGPEDRLAVGQTVSALGYTCTAGEQDMRCVHDASGHGFRMAPDSNDQF